MTDQHNYRTLGCYRDYLSSIGQKEQGFVWGDGVAVDTPHLDKLAKEGAIFTNFHTTAPLCTPNRASFVSGLYPAFTGADLNHKAMNEDVVTFAEVLQTEREYSTSYFGKWHLNGDESPGWGDQSNYYHFGYDEVKYLWNQGHWKFISEENGKMKEHLYWQGENKFDGKLNKHFTTDYIFDRGIEFMEKNRQSNEPFHAFLSIPDPHAPKEVRPPYDTMFNNLKFSLPYTAVTATRRDPASPLWNYHDFYTAPLDDDEVYDYLDEYQNRDFYQESLQSYFGMVKCIDDNVGKLMSYLKESGIDDNTIVVFTSDHGDMLSEHGKFNKNRPYRSSAGIPFLIRYPAEIRSGKVVETAYTSVDFAPSILSLMGVKNTDVGFQGVDFSNALLNDQQLVDSNTVRFVTDSGKKAKWSAAVMRQYKLILSDNDVPWLFDLNRDPFEIINYYGGNGVANVQDNLEAKLIEAMVKYEFPLAMKNFLIYLDIPACRDSHDRLPTNAVGAKCSDLGDTVPILDRCEKTKFQNHCPVTCGTCCEDSDGDVFLSQNFLNCSQLANSGQCNLNKVKQFCPELCNVCSATKIFS